MFQQKNKFQMFQQKNKFQMFQKKKTSFHVSPQKDKFQMFQQNLVSNVSTKTILKCFNNKKQVSNVEKTSFKCFNKKQGSNVPTKIQFQMLQQKPSFRCSTSTNQNQNRTFCFFNDSTIQKVKKKNVKKASKKKNVTTMTMTRIFFLKRLSELMRQVSD